MSDKLKSGVTVLPEFVAGETPSAAKLTAVGVQTRKGFTDVERAIGDVHDESWPYSADTTGRMNLKWGRNYASGAALAGAVDRYLGIVNLARLVGPAANLNPRMMTSNTVEETVPTGVHAFQLRYPHTGALSFSDIGVFATLEGTIQGMNASGDYFVDAGGKVYTFDVTSGGTVSYTVNPAVFGGGMNYPGSHFNVIPDPNQVQTGVYATTVTGPVATKYTVTLPQISEGQSNHAGTNVTLDASDANYDIQATLPESLTSELLAGEQIPGGLLLLRNNTLNQVYDEATYEYLNTTSFKIYNVDLDDAISNGDEFSVLCVGTDITTSIDDLRRKTHHSHDRTWGEPFIDANDLFGATAFPTALGAFYPSTLEGNFAPQYLHRDGFTTDETAANGRNCMRGWIAFGEQGATPPDYFGTSADSYGVVFGNPPTTDAPRIYRDANLDLVINADDAAGKIIRTEALVGADVGFGGDVNSGINFTGTKIASWFGTSTHDSDSLGLIKLDGTAGGPDLTGKTILSFAVMISDSTTGGKYIAQNGSADYQLNFIYDPANNHIEAWYLGTSWYDDGNGGEKYYRITVFYN